MNLSNLPLRDFESPRLFRTLPLRLHFGQEIYLKPYVYDDYNRYVYVGKTQMYSDTLYQYVTRYVFKNCLHETLFQVLDDTTPLYIVSEFVPF